MGSRPLPFSFLAIGPISFFQRARTFFSSRMGSRPISFLFVWATNPLSFYSRPSGSWPTRAMAGEVSWLIERGATGCSGEPVAGHGSGECAREAWVVGEAAQRPGRAPTSWSRAASVSTQPRERSNGDVWGARSWGHAQAEVNMSEASHCAPTGGVLVAGGARAARTAAGRVAAHSNMDAHTPGMCRREGGGACVREPGR